MKLLHRISLFLILFVFVSCLSLNPSSALAQDKKKNKDAESSKKEKKTKQRPKSPLEKKIKKLQLKNQLFQQKMQEELRELKRIQEKLDAKNSVLEKKVKQKELKTKMDLQEDEKHQKLQRMKQQIQQLKAKLNLASKRAEKELQKLKTKQKELSTEMELATTKKQHQLTDLKLELAEKELKSRLKQAETKLNKARLTNMKLEQQLKLARFNNKKSEMKAEIGLRQTRKSWKKKVSEPIKYINEPLQGKTLYVTDRRIQLNGPIITKTGDWVSRRIHYFNNRSEKYPIFIVIDDSPGGSVMEGFRILKAMKASKAPIYVVVKERAASMAAAIVTLGDRSFAFPDAIILHHEIQAYMGGSLTETEEFVEMMQKWWKRIATPIAEKMDLTVKEFRKRLYEENSNGNWQEFATEAKELNWVDRIVQNIEEVGIREEPEEDPPSPSFFFLKKKKGIVRKDDQGNYYQKLPPLRPYDFYYMYNPNNYYRW